LISSKPEILEMAEEVDPDGQRALGVVTRPDLVDKGTEKAVVDLIEGRHKNCPYSRMEPDTKPRTA
jgi:hypothetical protein